MWVRKRIDIEWSDLAAGLARSLWNKPRSAVEEDLYSQWYGAEHTFPCLSIRTGFDLLLKVLGLPAGSEVLMSAVTINDMVRIVEHHGLVPVPVDLDMRRLAPKLDRLRQAITPRTKAIVVAHLFGSRVPLEPIFEIAREHGLMVIEDCAQAFVGDGYRGHPDSDVSMFSFGPIKTATALGGAVFRIRDSKLLTKMREAYSKYPEQGRWMFLRRLVKYCGIKTISTRWFLGAVARVCRWIGKNHDGLANHVARGFAGPRFFDQIRKQPSTTLLSLMVRRVANVQSQKLALRISRGRTLIELLNGGVIRPGCDAADHSHWVFPIEVEVPEALLPALWRAGFDATQGQSHCVVEPPSDRPELEAVEAKRVIANTVFLPFSIEMPVSSLVRMAEVVRQECQRDAREEEAEEVALAPSEQMEVIQSTAAMPGSVSDPVVK